LHAPLHIPPLHDGVATLMVLQAMPQPPQLLVSVLVLMLQPLVLRVPSLQAGALLRQQHIDSSKSTQIPKHTNWYNRHCMRRCTFRRCTMVWQH